MSKQPSFLLIVIATILVISGTASAVGAPTKPDFLEYRCLNTSGNYTASSAYQANLVSVLSDLQSNASVSPFHSASAGLGESAVFAQYYCRGDIDSKLCGDCIQQAAQSVFGNCTLFKTAAIWYEECNLRYANKSMVGIEAILPLSAWVAKINTTDTVKLLSVLQTTFTGLISESTQGSNPTLFATGEGQMTDFQTVYCLVQCSPDLNATQCDTCLTLAYTLVSKYSVPMPAHIQLYFASCQLRYNSLFPFYPVKDAPLPPPGTPPLPVVPSSLINPLTPSTNATTSTKGGSDVLRTGGIGVLMTALTLLMLLVKM